MTKKLSEISKLDSKGKSEGNRIRFQLEEEVDDDKVNMTASLERNLVPEREPV